ncbi:MAG: ATP-grasp domain-containing protein [Patescibacteria group bacterium]
MEPRYDPRAWKALIPDIDRIIGRLEEAHTLSIGITPYTRIIPALFLRNYSIYVTKRSSDANVMERSVRLHVLEDRYPKVADKVHSTGYLLNSFAFQNFLKSWRGPLTLMVNTLTARTIEALERTGARWIGNAPETYQTVANKAPFRELVRSLGLPSLDSVSLDRSAFLASTFGAMHDAHQGAFVVQRGDKEVGGNEGTFFIRDQEAFDRCVRALATDESFESVLVTPFIDGYSCSMLGCVTEQGTLTGPLQLQLIDVPEALHGVEPSGIFLGNDLGFRPWSAAIEQSAQEVVEGIGAHLFAHGYRGIFGIDFLYDSARDRIYPNECNPRFTGSLVLYSLSLLEAGIPPLEFFHLIAQLGIKADFDFDAVNAKLKSRLAYSHVALSPKGIPAMSVPLMAGIYEFDPAGPALAYVGPGITLSDIQNERQFLLIDTVPSVGTVLEQEVPRLFKFIFPRSIALSSYEVDEQAGYLLERFAKTLIRASPAETTPERD